MLNNLFIHLENDTPRIPIWDERSHTSSRIIKIGVPKTFPTAFRYKLDPFTFLCGPLEFEDQSYSIFIHGNDHEIEVMIYSKDKPAVTVMVPPKQVKEFNFPSPMGQFFGIRSRKEGLSFSMGFRANSKQFQLQLAYYGLMGPRCMALPTLEEADKPVIAYPLKDSAAFVYVTMPAPGNVDEIHVVFPKGFI